MQTAFFFVFRSSVCIVSVQNRTYLYVALPIFVFVKMNALFMVVDICFFMKMKNEVTLVTYMRKAYVCGDVQEQASKDTTRTKETTPTLT